MSSLKNRRLKEAQINNNPIGFVICRVGAVLVAVSAIGGLGLAIEPMLDGSLDLGYLIRFALMLLAPFIVAILLWSYADQISHIPFAAPRPSIMGDFDPEELVRIGTQLIGIYVLSFGVISMFGTESLALAQSSIFKDSETIRESMSSRTISGRVTYAVQIILGVALILRGKRRIGS